jgi:predicted PurR-regulated permease PerM
MFKRNDLLSRSTLILLFLILLLYGLIAARNFLYPIFISLLFAYLLYPVVSFLEKKAKFPRILANLVSIIAAGVFIFFLIYFMVQQLDVFVKDFPVLTRRALENVDQIEQFIEEKVGVASSDQHTWIKTRISELFQFGSDFFGSAFTATTSTLTKVFLMPVFVFFLLYYRNKFRRFILMVIPQDKHKKTKEIINEVSKVTERYMGGIVLVVLILFVLNSVGLMIVGLNYAILLGIISALFNFIPYFGTLIGGIVPLLYAMLLSDDPSKALGVIILFIIIQFIENNILTPNITGGNVRLNPFVTILSIIIGGMIWGIPGMFLSIPFMAILKIVCEQIEELHPYSFLLGTSGTEEHSLTWEKFKKFFNKKRTPQF